MYRLFARLRSFVSGLRQAGHLDAEMNEEMRFHMEMEAQRLMRERGLEPQEARRQAALAFGNVEHWQEEGRAVRGLSQLNGLSLDVKLAWRMIVKSPGLTLVAGLGMTLSIAVCVGFFTVSASFFSPRISLGDGDRLV